MPRGSKTWRTQAREGGGVGPRAPAAAASAPALAPVGEDEATTADALTMSAMQGDEEGVAALLAMGADADAKDQIGVAPLHWGAFCGHGGVTRRLLAAGAEVHVRDQEGRTPLHVAAYESHSEVIAQLLKAGADVMAPDKMSWTPLHCAVSNGELDACKQLTEAGADPKRKDSEGKSAMDLAKHFGNAGIVEVLEGAQEQNELLALKSMGIGSGSHRGARPPLPASSRSPTSISSPLPSDAAAVAVS